MRAALALVVTIAVGGCTRVAPAAATGRRTVRDGLGRPVLVPDRVARVVSLSPSSTEIVYALGAGDRVVGLDRYSDWPPETRKVDKVGANLEPSLERIVALRPDLVLTATTANTQATTQAIERTGIAVFVSKADTLAQIYEDIESIGDAIGRLPEARVLTRSMRARLEALRARHAGRRPVRTLLVVWSEPLVVAGRASHLDDLITAAGGVNIVDDSAIPFPNYSLERVMARAPEALVVGTHAYGSPPLAPLERLTTVPAVRDHRVYLIDGDLLFRPGPRVVEGAEALARLLVPEEAHVPPDR